MTRFSSGWGRLGNQMFGVALLFSVRERTGHDFFLPHDGEALWDCFDLDVPAGGPEPVHAFRERFGYCNFDAGVFEQPDGTDFEGYFQSYRYVEGLEDALRAFLRFRPPDLEFASLVLDAYRSRYERPIASLHVRRTDYVNPGAADRWGDLAADGYYQRAVEAIGDEVVYVVFSDDVAWCEASLELPASRVEYADIDAVASICLMTGCDVNVVANSSFSWWGAFLNARSEVYAPSRWWGPAMPPPDDRQEIVPPAWTKLPVFADVVRDGSPT